MCAKQTGKIYYTMGEVTEMFDVNPSLIRFWESKFDILKPHKNKKGNRLFTPADIENLKLIYHLVKEKGMTLSGAAQQIKSNKEGIARDLEVVDRLLAIKAMLAEIKQELRLGADFEPDPEEEFIPVNTTEDLPEEEIPAQEGVPMIEEPEGAVNFSFMSDELDHSGFDTGEAPPEETAWELQEPEAAVPADEVPVQQIVADNITEIAGEELHEEYIGQLSDEIAEEAATAAEVREALAELEKTAKKAPEAFEQTLF